jgi:hypothetical protein
MMQLPKVYTASFTMYYGGEPGVVDYVNDRVFSTMEKAIAFVAETLATEFQECDWLDENQKLSAPEITEKCNECIEVNPETGLVHMVYNPRDYGLVRLAVYEMEVW